MIEGLKPYPEMKDTGLPWADQVPSHWQLVPNRALLRKRKLLVGDRHTEYRLLSLTKAGVIVRDISTGRGKFSADMGTSQEVREGDLVFCLFDVPETPRTVGLSKHHGMITGAYTIFACEDSQVTRFLEAFYIAMDDRKLLSPLYSGLRNTIPPPVLLGQKTPLPPASEQAAIVRFIDHADRKIRRYIRAKQKLIKLLEEQKQAIIHRAVTRGLDPNVRLKPSGVEWLGEVPEHWKVAKLSLWFRCTSGATPSRGTDSYYGGDIPWIKTGELLNGEIHSAVEKVTMKAVKDTNLTLLPVDTLLIAMYGQGQTRGRTGLLKIEATVNQATLAILPNAVHATPKFMQLWFISQYPYLRYLSEARNATQPNLNSDIIKALKITLPPPSEQEQIVEATSAETETIKVAIDHESREINLLHEYRTRLIADVVTGKLDVREAAAQLPDEDQELPPIDESDEISDAEEDDFDDLDEGTEEPEP